MAVVVGSSVMSVVEVVANLIVGSATVEPVEPVDAYDGCDDVSVVWIDADVG